MIHWLKQIRLWIEWHRFKYIGEANLVNGVWVHRPIRRGRLSRIWPYRKGQPRD